MAKAGRITDSVSTHCGDKVYVAEGSGNVFANSLGITRVTDANTPHLTPSSLCLATHITRLGVGSNSVFVNGLKMGRLADTYIDSEGPLKITSGSSDVFAGK